MTAADITVTNLYGTEGLQPSISRIRRILRHARTPYLYLTLRHEPVSVTPTSLIRMADVSSAMRCSMLYTDYYDESLGRVIMPDDYTSGSVRDDFDLGPGVMIHVETAHRALEKIHSPYPFAGFYAFRLVMSMIGGGIYHLPESLVVVRPKRNDQHMEVNQFDYVDINNRKRQADFETAFINYLRATDALLTRHPNKVEIDEHAYPVTASVIIPVYNRVTTIRDAITSALSQSTSFTYNILVVDNYSSDGTTEIVREISKSDSRVVLITPKHKGHGIGGCWNEAINHRLCGAYAVQLDSDDLYSTPQTLQTIIELFRETNAAMVVGSYNLTDFQCNTIPPGIIDHREWTPENGRNNLLRVNGIGAPRAFVAEVCRRYPFPDVSYGEDYAMALRISRDYLVERIFEPIYTCRRWEGNSDSGISDEQHRKHNYYKDRLRAIEITARRNIKKIGR